MALPQSPPSRPLLRLHGRLRRLALGKGLATAPRPTPRIGELSANGTPTPAAGRAGGAPLVLTVGMVGPWRSGKSELTDAACLGLSRLVLRTDCTWMWKTRGGSTARPAQRRLDATLMRQPRLTTLHDRLQSVALLEAGQARLRLELHDPVGQLVRFTTPSAPSDLRQRCDAYQQGLASRDVLWQVLPCPSRGAGRAEVQAFQDALRTTTAYVRAALNQRPAGSPLNLAIVLTRIDARYAGEAEARQRLPHEALAGLARLHGALEGLCGVVAYVASTVELPERTGQLHGRTPHNAGLQRV